jgi:single-stranded DNA-binding protein
MQPFSVAGNLSDHPELRHTESGIARAMFRVAVSGRREQEASFFTVVVWRDQAEHAAQSPAKGGRPGGGRGSVPAAGLDYWGRRRPLDC